jgi:hypothetical protein
MPAPAGKPLHPIGAIKTAEAKRGTTLQSLLQMSRMQLSFAATRFARGDEAIPVATIGLP